MIPGSRYVKIQTAFTLLFLVSTSVFAEEEPSTSIDWSKPMVSRGFGRSDDLPQQDIPTRQSYKAGEVAYFYRDYPRARHIWQQLAENGLADAQANLGWLYQAGLGVETDYAKARLWYEKAEIQQHPVALNNLGALYENGLGVDKDESKAFDFYLRSAKLGYRYGQYNAGLLLLEGRGVTTDKKQAHIWLNKASEQGVEAASKLLIPK